MRARAQSGLLPGRFLVCFLFFRLSVFREHVTHAHGVCAESARRSAAAFAQEHAYCKGQHENDDRAEAVHTVHKYSLCLGENTIRHIPYPYAGKGKSRKGKEGRKNRELSESFLPVSGSGGMS